MCTVVVHVGTPLEELTVLANIRLRILLETCRCNKLSVNPTKSDFIVVANTRLSARPKLLIGSDLIKELSSFEYLEVYIDARLKYNIQIKYIKKYFKRTIRTAG